MTRWLLDASSKFKREISIQKSSDRTLSFLPRGLIDLLERVFSTLGLSLFSLHQLFTLMTSTGRNTTTNTAPKYAWFHLACHFLIPLYLRVDRYLNDFSKALAGEVRILLDEVGKLRDERRQLQ